MIPFKSKTTFILLSLLLIISLMAAQCGAAVPTEAPKEESAAPATEAPAEEPAAEVPATEAPAEESAAEAPATEEVMAEPAAEATEAPVEEEAMAEGSGVELPEVNPLEVTGDIISAGSSTVFPLSERMAERFQDEGYASNITIDSIGSGAGFERFCVAGETDIANASRAIKEEEIASCEGIGRTPIEFRVGTDALAVVVSAENDFLTDVTKEQLAHIFSDAEKWSDVDPAWPAEPILRFSPGTDSGTFDYFVEAVMDPVYVVDKEADKGKGEEAILQAANLQLSEDDNVLAQGVEGSPYAIGYFGYAYYQNEADALKVISIESVEPTAETAENGGYPLARPLFIYSDAKIMAEKPQVAAFINFYLSYVNEEIEDVGYFPASAAALDTAKNNWLAAASGEMPVEAAVEEPAAAATEAVAEEAAVAEGSGVELPEVNPLDVSGDIIAAGSSTVFPLSERMAERFQDEGYAGNITIDSIGSGAGFERFCVAGETDIANASRAIKEEEIASCESIGRTPIEFRVGTDALAVVVSAENDFLTDVTIEQLAHIFSDAEKWSDVDPSWPAEPILRFSPGTDSGTFDYFVEAVMDPVYVVDEASEGKGEEAILQAANLQLSEDDNVLAQGVEGSPYAIGYFGYAYYQNEADALKAISIEGVEPTGETAEDGSYPLARPLFIYSDVKIMAEKPQVASFINFYLSYVNEEIEDVGYFPASATALDTAKNNWLDANPQ